MTYDEGLIDRYKAVVAHAERGEGNEKANAQRLRQILRNLRATRRLEPKPAASAVCQACGVCGRVV